MNPLMIQQATATARTLPMQTSPAAKDGSFEAIAASLLGGEPVDQDKTAQADAANPLAALLLAAMAAQAQPQPQPQPMTEEPQMADAGAAPDTLAAMSAQPRNERLTTLLQGLGMNADEAAAFAARLADAVQARATADRAPNAALAGQEGADDAVAQVRSLLDNLLANEAGPTAEQPAALPEARLDIGTAIKLRAALSSLGATQPASQATMPPQAQTVAPQTARNAAMHNETQTAEQAVSTPPTAPTVAAASAASAETSIPVISTVAVACGEEEQSAATGQGGSDSTGQDAPAAAAPMQDAAASVLPFAAPPRAQATVREPQAHSVTRPLGEAFDTMVDTLSALRQGPRSEMEIHLKPDFLGKVVIKLTLEEGSLVARISASNAGVQEAFQAQAPSLTAALQQQGVKDVTVLVAHDAAAGGMLDHSTSSRHNQNPREQRRRAAISLDVADKSDAVRAAQAYEQFWRSGTINYLA